MTGSFILPSILESTIFSTSQISSFSSMSTGGVAIAAVLAKGHCFPGGVIMDETQGVLFSIDAGNSAHMPNCRML